MRIALLSSAEVVHTHRWAEALAERGHRVDLISIQPPDAGVPEGVAFHRLPYSAPAGYVLAAPALRRLLARLAPDILHAHYASGYGLLGRLARFRPWILSVWGSDVYHFPDQAGWKRRMVRTSLQGADWVCSTSDAMAEQTKRIAPNIERLSTVAFGIDPERFKPLAVPAICDTITIGTVKTLRPVYGVDLLIRGFAACREILQGVDRKTADRLRLRIVGAGWQRPELERLTRQLGLAQVTTFTGQAAHENVPDELRKLDIYVAASRAESFGVAVIEAAACGLPVVVSRVGGLPEVVADGETGIVVPPENPAAIADALVRLVNDAALRRRLGAAGRQRAIERYLFSNNVSQMIDIYEQLIGRSDAVSRAA